jgi:hypothetical protein
MCPALVEAHAREAHLWGQHELMAVAERVVRFFTPVWN